MSVRILVGDVREKLRDIPNDSIHCCVSSPPYYGLRSYIDEGHPLKSFEIGLEPTYSAYIETMVSVFREVRRVLRSDGTLWLNLGDSYAGSGKGGNPDSGKQSTNKGSQTVGVLYGKTGESARTAAVSNVTRNVEGLAPKNLIGIPWRVALALQDDGWWLRQDIIWSKPNPMPESVTDRCTKAHEYVFLMSKSSRYLYDADAIRTPLAAKTFTTFGTKHHAQGNDDLGGVKSDNWGKSLETRKPKLKVSSGWDRGAGGHGTIHRDGRGKPEYQEAELAGANARSVWEIATESFADAHFATFPTELARRCILAGCPEGGTVLDPFGGAGTTGLVADRLKRNAILIELNPAYAEMARKRIAGDAGMFGDIEAVSA